MANLKDSVKQGRFLGFIPYCLEIDGRPELSVFPLNILFAKYKCETDGRKIMGNALYKPDLESFRSGGKECSMTYRNAYGGNSHLVIKYDQLKKNYTGEKVVNGKWVGMAEGPEWKMFFVHFTALGLSNGERCELEDITQQ